MGAGLAIGQRAQWAAHHGRNRVRPAFSRPAGRATTVNVEARRAGTKQKKAPLVTTLEWTSPLEVVSYPDPRLRAVNGRIGTFDDNLKRLAAEMFEVMYEDEGVGLAAPQVGVNARLMVYNESGIKGEGTEIIMVNPELVEVSKATVVSQEGCLSFRLDPSIAAGLPPSPSTSDQPPRDEHVTKRGFVGIYGQVRRPQRIQIRAQDATGQPIELVLEDFKARLFLHEFDHLQGTLFFDRMASDVLETVRPQLVALEEAYMAAHPGQKIQRLAPLKVFKGFG